MALKISSGGGAEKKRAEKPANDGGVFVKGRYEIKVEEPLPDYDSAPAVAFRATTVRDTERSLFALVCDPKVPPRLEMIPTLHRLDHGSMVNVIDWDVVDWPLEGRRCPALILPRPGGKKFLNGPKDERKPLTEDFVTRHFIQPAVEILREIHNAGETHRALRPDNIYFTDDDESGLVIGECFSAQPAIAQPIVLETLEASLSAPGGRGEGIAANDLYSLGVCILALLIGKYPCSNLSDDEIVSQKLAIGSYTTIAQNYRVSLTIMEVLRGLLSDDVSDRWSVEDLALWINGRRLSPKQPALPNKATRPFSVGGKEYVTARELANAMARNWDDATKVVLDGTLEGWLRRSLGDEVRTEAMGQAKGLGDIKDDPDRAVARAIIALDPDGPIRLRGLSATMGGVGVFGAIYCDDEAAKKLVAEIIQLSLPAFWMEQQMSTRPELSHAVARLDRMRATLMRPGIGYGLERVLYELNTDLPCRSPLFERDYVATLDHLLPALERKAIAADGNVKLMIDREVAAYIGAHYRRSVGGELGDVELDNKAEAATAQVRLLAMLQDSLARGKPFPGLCKASAKLLQPAIEKFQSRTTRKRILQSLQKAEREGRLQSLVAIVTNPSEVQQDANGYLKATNDYTRSAVDMIKLRHDMKNKGLIAAHVGGQVSSGLAGIIAAIIFAVAAIVRLA